MKREFGNEEEMSVYAKQFLEKLAPNTHGATMVGLSGDLGSGKTTFTKLFARALGITEDIVSPTYVIAKFYDIRPIGAWNKLVHIDAYRIDDPEEVRALRWDELIGNPQHLVLIEWPERIGSYFPASAPLLTFQFINDTMRAIIDGSEDTSL